MPSPDLAALDGREEIGDPSAPYGSLGWVRYLRFWTIEVKRDARSKAIDLKRSLQSLEEDEHWRSLADQNGGPFVGWEDFCQYPEPWGLGMTMAEVKAILQETDPTATVVTVLGRHGGDRKSAKAKADQGSKPNLDRGARYQLDRLDRDRPDLAARVRAGELSANAAAIEAGFRKPRTPFQSLRSAWKHASDEERRDFLREIGAVFAGERRAA